MYFRYGDAMEALNAIRIVCYVLPFLGVGILLSSIILVLEWAFTPQLSSFDRIIITVYFLSAALIGIMMIWFSVKGLRGCWTTWYDFTLATMDLLCYTVVITGSAGLLMEFTSPLLFIILGGLMKYCLVRIREMDYEDRRSPLWLAVRILAICCLALGGLTIDWLSWAFALIDVLAAVFHSIALAVVFLNRYGPLSREQAVAAAPARRGPWPHPCRG